jgi:hypothetical protein
VSACGKLDFLEAEHGNAVPVMAAIKHALDPQSAHPGGDRAPANASARTQGFVVRPGHAGAPPQTRAASSLRAHRADGIPERILAQHSRKAMGPIARRMPVAGWSPRPDTETFNESTGSTLGARTRRRAATNRRPTGNATGLQDLFNIMIYIYFYIQARQLLRSMQHDPQTIISIRR